MNINADFISDYRNILRQLLQEDFNLNTDTIDNSRILEIFFDIHSRIPMKTPRTVYESDTFVCPDGLEEKWFKLKSALTTGANLMPYLSHEIINRPEIKKPSKRPLDGLLYDWGIHHLHLTKDFNDDNHLLFAVITDDTFYAIDILSHDGHWSNHKLLETINRNWPKTLEHYQFNGLTAIPITEAVNYRKCCANAVFSLSDGTVLFSPGGGMMSNGFGMKSSTNLMIELEQIRVYEAYAIQKANLHFKAQKTNADDDITLQLVFTKNRELVATISDFSLGIRLITD
jgi:hypothetical protein